jgi:hypothetical protein
VQPDLLADVVRHAQTHIARLFVEPQTLLLTDPEPDFRECCRW